MTRLVRKLVIHAPKNGKTPFNTILTHRIGPDYAIYNSLYNQVTPITSESRVVLLANDSKQREEGRLVKLVKKGLTKNGIWRYDVHFEDMHNVTYRNERLNRCGVTVIEEEPDYGKGVNKMARK